ncbi:MAG: hypothetical protein M0010_15340 [Actinomycetota bacterium]|nr:hypothetical protein [Actinomycetota bacterium]
MPKRSSEDDKGQKLQLLLALLAVAAEIWFVLIPEHRRKEILLQLTRRTKSLCSRLARRIGEREMAAELRGERPAYELSYFFSCVRDRASELYESIRSR